MNTFGRICVLVPARSGSKTVKNKNIRIMNGHPLMAYSIMDGLNSQYVDSVIVSTDSQRYADIAESYGAKVPFLRPDNISGDGSLDIEVFQHFCGWMEKNNYELPEIIVHLRPTHPYRRTEDIDKCIEILLNNPQIDSVRSVAKAKEVPYKMWLFNDDGRLMNPLVACNIEEAYNAPRQVLPTVYMQNACIDVIRTKTIMEKHSMTGDNIAGYRMDYDFDIDTEADFIRTEQFMTVKDKIGKSEGLKIVCDIDGVIANKTIGNDYSRATPIEKNIQLLRRIHNSGNMIVLHTARGYATGIDWKQTTLEQMKQWGVPFDDLVFGKPDADFYIDDKATDLVSLVQILGKER